MGALTHGAKLVCFNLFFNFHLNMMNLCLPNIFTGFTNKYIGYAFTSIVKYFKVLF